MGKAKRRQIVKFIIGFVGFIFLLVYLTPNSYINRDGVVVHKPKYEIYKKADNG